MDNLLKEIQNAEFQAAKSIEDTKKEIESLDERLDKDIVENQKQFASDMNMKIVHAVEEAANDAQDDILRIEISRDKKIDDVNAAFERNRSAAVGLIVKGFGRWL